MVYEKGDACKLQAYWTGTVLYRKVLVFEKFFVLRCCLGKHVVLEWFKKKVMITNYKHSEPVLLHAIEKTDGWLWMNL